MFNEELNYLIGQLMRMDAGTDEYRVYVARLTDRVKGCQNWHTVAQTCLSAARWGAHFTYVYTFFLKKIMFIY